MAITVKRGKHVHWIDAEGLVVPLKHISEKDRRRDEVAEKVVNMAIDLQEDIIKRKAEMREILYSYLEEVAESYGEEWQGNAVITSFSGDKQVQVRQHKLQEFDETLQVAKTKIDKCIVEWSKGSKTELIALVNQAFRVDKKGNLDVRALLKLPSLEIDDPTWKEAMDIIRKAVQVRDTKEYFNFKVRDENGQLKPLTLQFSQL